VTLTAVLVASLVTVLVVQSLFIARLSGRQRHLRGVESELLKQQAELERSYGRIRNLAARLIDAQEMERARLARDLHDDVSQQIALLSLDLEQLGDTAQTRSAIQLSRETMQRTKQVAKSIHELSHRLHPAKLRLIGLIPSLESLCREMSQPGLDVTFTHEGVRLLVPDELSLCLYRIVQEGVRNAIKYSQGRNVVVDLRSHSDRLSLQILDDGVGFDASTMWGKGLGLISMHERLEAVGGSLEIDSKPAHGTRLQVDVPLTLDAAPGIRIARRRNASRRSGDDRGV
jgi:signal transduction histidine kinase